MHNWLKPKKKVWCLTHLKIRNLQWRPVHCFLLSRESWSGVLFSETPTRGNWEDLFLKATRITCSIKRDQTWRSKSFMSSPSTSASLNYNDKKEQQRLALKSAKVKRNSWDNTKPHFTNAPNARTDEFYGWLWRFSRCGIKLKWKVVSRFQSTCNDSEFSRLAQQRQKIAAWHMESVWMTRKFWNQFSTFDSPRDHPQRIQSDNVKETEKQFLMRKGRRLVTQVKTDKIKAQFQCRHMRQSRWLRVPQDWWNYRGNTWSDSKDSNYRNCNSTNSLIHNRSLVENSIQKSSHYLFWLFHRMPCCESKKCIDGLWRGEHASTRKLSMLTCGSRFRKSCNSWSQKKSRWKWSMSRRTVPRRTKKRCRTLRSLSLGAAKKRMS